MCFAHAKYSKTMVFELALEAMAHVNGPSSPTNQSSILIPASRSPSFSQPEVLWLSLYVFLFYMIKTIIWKWEVSF